MSRFEHVQSDAATRVGKVGVSHLFALPMNLELGEHVRVLGPAKLKAEYLRVCSVGLKTAEK